MTVSKRYGTRGSHLNALLSKSLLRKGVTGETRGETGVEKNGPAWKSAVGRKESRSEYLIFNMTTLGSAHINAASSIQYRGDSSARPGATCLNQAGVRANAVWARV